MAPSADAGVYAVYSVGVDDRNGTVWTTNTRQNTVAIYRQSGLGLVKQFAPGAGALNVVFDPVKRLAYVTNRGAGTLTVVDPDGNIKANLELGTFPNHAVVDGKGVVYAVNKAKGQDDAEGDRITRVVAK